MKRWLDRLARADLVAGTGLMLPPFGGEGLGYGFFASAGCPRWGTFRIIYASGVVLGAFTPYLRRIV